MAALDALLTLVRELAGDELFAGVWRAALEDKTLGLVLLDRRLAHHRSG